MKVLPIGHPACRGTGIQCLSVPNVTLLVSYTAHYFQHDAFRLISIIEFTVH